MTPRRYTRREFVARTGGLVVVIGTGGVILAACGDDDEGEPNLDQLPLPRVDDPITLPDNGISAIDSGLDPETGTFSILSYPDYFNPDSLAAFEELYGVEISMATFETEAQLLSRLQTTPFDLVVGATTLGLPRFVVGELVQPINLDYITNFDNVLPSLQSPYYDVGSKYSVPYTMYTTGLAYRRDVIDDAAIAATGWDTIWDPANRGFVGIIDDARDALTMGMYKLGITDTNTSDAAVINQARDAIAELVEATNARIDIFAYQKIPEGTSHINQAWSGDMINAQYYLPDDVGTEVLGFWVPDRTTVANDFSVIPATSERPVLAHLFIDFLTDPANALQNFEFVGYQPALSDPSPAQLLAAELVPAHLTSTLVTDSQMASGYRLDALAPEVQILWEDAFQEIKAG